MARKDPVQVSLSDSKRKKKKFMLETCLFLHQSRVQVDKRLRPNQTPAFGKYPLASKGKGRRWSKIACRSPPKSQLGNTLLRQVSMD